MSIIVLVSLRRRHCYTRHHTVHASHAWQLQSYLRHFLTHTKIQKENELSLVWASYCDCGHKTCERYSRVSGTMRSMS